MTRNSTFKWTLFAIGGVAACAISGLVGAVLSRNFGTSSDTISYADFISVMLTAVSLLITLLAFILAILGVVGWSSITERVQRRTEEFLSEGFQEGNQLFNMLQSRATTIIYDGIDSVSAASEDDSEGEI